VVDLTIIIVSWNVRDLLRNCLRSIVDIGYWGLESAGADANIRYPISNIHYPISSLQFEVIVVDNGSTDGSREMVGAEFPQVRLIANDQNRGFTAANNQGLAVSQGHYLLLLNPDTELVGDAWRR